MKLHLQWINIFTKLYVTLIFNVLVLFISSQVAAGDGDADKVDHGGRMVIEACRTESIPVIDGRLDDTVWKKAKAYGDFRTFEPEYGIEISEKTLVFAAYDKENLYFAFDCTDSKPDMIKATKTKRDNIFNEDIVAVFLDTHNDLNSAYVFFVNACGVQGDLMMNADGNGDASSADFIWESGGYLNGVGYSVEMRIPLHSIRFKGGETVTMGLGLHRAITRTSERTMFPEINPAKGSVISQSALVHYKGIQSRRRVEILPAVTWTQRREHQEGRMTSIFNRKEFGVTGKLGISSTLTLDGTYNPDFSQVEADARQIDEVNTRYAIYYSETRPFFTEGQENFEFSGLNMSSPIWNAVHTRTIVDPIAGLKLSGKLGKRNSLASILAVDEFPVNTRGSRANIGIIRYKRLTDDDSYLGSLLTARSVGREYNGVVGIDFKKRINGNMKLDGNIIGSISRNETSEKQPGQSANLVWSYDSPNYYMAFAFHTISEKFQMDPAFISRTGVSRAVANFSRRFYEKDEKLVSWIRKGFRKLAFQRVNTGIYVSLTRDLDYDMNERYGELYINFNMPLSTQLGFSYILASEIYMGKSFLKNSVDAYLQTTPKPWISGSLSIEKGKYPYYDPDDPSQGNRLNGGVSLTLRPTRDLSVDISHSRSIFHLESNGEQLYDFRLYRGRLTYQINQYLYVRGIAEYDEMDRILTSDFLMSFTYIPGTVFHLGYGSRHERLKYIENDYVAANHFMTMKHGFFIKVSYNWIF